MSNQDKHTIVNQLVTQIAALTDGGAPPVALFKSVSTDELDSSQIGADMYPFLIVSPANDTQDYEMTNTVNIHMTVNLYFGTKDGEQNLYTLEEAVLCSIAKNPTIAGTCILANLKDGEPFMWERADNDWRSVRHIDILYRRDTF